MLIVGFGLKVKSDVLFQKTRLKLQMPRLLSFLLKDMILSWIKVV
jgi:hypothetical protein